MTGRHARSMPGQHSAAIIWATPLFRLLAAGLGVLVVVLELAGFLQANNMVGTLAPPAPLVVPATSARLHGGGVTF